MTFMARAAGARLVVAGTALACLTMLVGGCGTATDSSDRVEHLRARGVSRPILADPSAPAGTARHGLGRPDADARPDADRSARVRRAEPRLRVPRRSVQVTLGLSQGTKSVTYLGDRLHQPRSQACSLGGYPGASLAGGTPLAQIGLAAMRLPAEGSVQPVVLNPGQVANALLQISHASNFPRPRAIPSARSTW